MSVLHERRISLEHLGPAATWAKDLIEGEEICTLLTSITDLVTTSQWEGDELATQVEQVATQLRALAEVITDDYRYEQVKPIAGVAHHMITVSTQLGLLGKDMNLARLYALYDSDGRGARSTFMYVMSECQGFRRINCATSDRGSGLIGNNHPAEYRHEGILRKFSVVGLRRDGLAILHHPITREDFNVDPKLCRQGDRKVTRWDIEDNANYAQVTGWWGNPIPWQEKD